MNFMWYSSSRVPYHFCYMDTICNPYKYDGYIKSIWASYGNATGECAVGNIFELSCFGIMCLWDVRYYFCWSIFV